MDEAKAESVAPAFERALQREQRAPAAQVPAAFGHAERGVDGVGGRQSPAQAGPVGEPPGPHHAADGQGLLEPAQPARVARIAGRL